MTQDNVISEIKIGPSLLIAGASVAFGALISEFVKDDLGRASFLSALVIMLSIYSCRESIKYPRIVLYILIFAIVHACISVTFGSALEHISGPIIIIIAIVDYAIFYTGAQFISRSL